MSDALDIEAVAVRLGGVAVLDDVSLHVGAGRRMALVGPSGAGKTTLLRAVAGLAELHAGDIRLGGISLHGVPTHRRRVAVVFQEPRLLPHLDVAENVALPLRAAGCGKTERARRAEALLEEVGLRALARRRVTGLSGGEQQRVGLARALCADPGVLLLDEPLAALDPNRREELRRLLVRLQEEHALTLLLVTHDRSEAAELGERVALLLDGRIAQEGTPAELFQRPATVEVARFFGTENVLRGTVRDGRLQVEGTRIALAVHGADGPATYVIRPEQLRPAEGGGISARVMEAVYTGAAVRVRLESGPLRLTAVLAPDEAPAVGSVVAFAPAAGQLWRIPEVGA